MYTVRALICALNTASELYIYTPTLLLDSWVCLYSERHSSPRLVDIIARLYFTAVFNFLTAQVLVWGAGFNSLSCGEMSRRHADRYSGISSGNIIHNEEATEKDRADEHQLSSGCGKNSNWLRLDLNSWRRLHSWCCNCRHSSEKLVVVRFADVTWGQCYC